MFESPLNSETPRVVPRAAAPEPMAVDAHLIWPAGEEWTPAVATRWTRTHVLVQLPARGAIAVWLRASDVRRGDG
jgi:hypothetical protein